MKDRNITAIISARTGSSRLPNKVLLDISGKTALERMITHLSKLDTEKSIWDMSTRFYTLLLAIENDLRMIEIPITFKRRIGESKYSGQSVSKSLKIGFNFLWLIFRY